MATLSQSPTFAGTLAASGVILGTAGYMSPEQARGKPVDRRADIWAFGVVLHELLTGTRVFEGETISDTLAAVLRAEPDHARLPAELPPAVRALQTPEAAFLKRYRVNVLVTHDAAIARRCDRQLHIEAGRLVGASQADDQLTAAAGSA